MKEENIVTIKLELDTSEFEQKIKELATELNNHTLDDLKQKLINELYNKTFYEQTDIEMLKVLFENEKKTASEINLDAKKIISEINKPSNKEKYSKIIL